MDSRSYDKKESAMGRFGDSLPNRRVSAMGWDQGMAWSGAEKWPQRLQRMRKQTSEGRGWRSWKPGFL